MISSGNLKTSRIVKFLTSHVNATAILFHFTQLNIHENVGEKLDER